MSLLRGKAKFISKAVLVNNANRCQELGLAPLDVFVIQLDSGNLSPLVYLSVAHKTKGKMPQL